MTCACNNCPKCKQRAYQKAWYLANKEKVRAKEREWEENNRAKIAANQRKHAARKREYYKEYYHKNRERVLDKNEQWRKENLAVHNSYNLTSRKKAARRARRGVISRSHTIEVAQYLEILHNDPCCYCGSRSEHIDHIDPISRGGSGDWDNLTASCGSCNRKKHDSSLLSWMLRATA